MIQFVRVMDAVSNRELTVSLVFIPVLLVSDFVQISKTCFCIELFDCSSAATEKNAYELAFYISFSQQSSLDLPMSKWKIQ